MKKTIISCLCSVFAVSLIGGVTLFDNSVSVSAEETMTAPSFIMENGAAVCKDGGGLRFSANLDIDTYNAIKDNEEVKFGMIIVPADSIYVDATTLEYADSSVYAKTGHELTVENIWGAMPKFSVEPTVSQKQIIDEEATLENNSLVVGSEVVTLYGAIENFHEQNYVRSFVGRAYYYTEESGYVFADYYDDTANDNEAPIENNTRCMYYVAQLAIEKGDDLATSVQTTYIDGFEQYLTDNNKSGRYRYFVDTYIDDVLASTESAYAKINSNVSVTPEDKDGYAVNQVRSKLAGTVYAAGKQRLVIRYESAPEAEIETATESELAAINAEEIKIYGTTEEVVLETAYTFEVTETAEEAEASAYANWIADYYVTVDRSIGENELGLAGSYANWDSGNWVAFYAPATEANVATPLLGSVGGEWTYAELVKEVQSFDCGAFDANNVLGGMTMTVELRLTNPYDETDYIVVNKTEHTFAVPPEAEIEVATEEELAQINAEEIKIYGTTEEVVLETAYTFEVTETAEEAEASAYANWIADYYVTVDRSIGENELGLAGSYANWDNGNWVAFYAPATKANVATPLLGSVGGEWTYAELVKEVGTFDCGAFDANNVLGGMTMTVELRLTNPYDETDYIVINKTEHTFAIPPTASIETATEEKLATINTEEIKIYGTTEEVVLETAYTFEVTETAEEAEASAYANWIADYYVTVDRAIGENELGLAGSYANWDNGNWVAFYAPATKANVATPLLGSVGGEWTYAELVKEVGTFDCGAFDANNVLGGMTMTVELRLTNPYDETDYIVVSKTEHTFAVPPTASIETLEELPEVTPDGGETVTLETGYTFSTMDGAEDAAENYYAKWNADYVVSFDKAIKANTIGLAGSYASWEDGAWIAFLIDRDMSVGEGFQILASANVTVNYTELCTNVISFDCGAYNLASENIGTTMTVELRLINPNDASDYIVVNSTSYTFVKTAGAPTATIETATEEKLAAINAETIEIYGEAGTDVTLETAYTFSTTEVSETASASVYANWNADYVVSFDKAVNANTVCLAGSYDSWDNGKWIAFMIGSDLVAGENFQLLASANVTVNYTELCTNVISFDCGASNLASENIGTTMTVELRLINPNDATDYIVINSTSYTFE